MTGMDKRRDADITDQVLLTSSHIVDSLGSPDGSLPNCPSRLLRQPWLQPNNKAGSANTVSKAGRIFFHIYTLNAHFEHFKINHVSCYKL